MSTPKENKEKQTQELIGDDKLSFSWGVRKGTINLYESFTLDGTDYSLFDSVYVSVDSRAELGKIIKILETENHEKKVEVVWFFKPNQVVKHLGNVKPLEKEVFLACGEGIGLSNVCPLEAVCGACNVVCSSKDPRNPQPTEKQLKAADCIFYRAFDVGTRKVLEEFPSSIAAIEVNHFFNRTPVASIVGSEPKAHVRAMSGKGDCRSNVPGSTSSSSGGQMKSSIKDRVHAGGNIKKSVHFAQASPSDSHLTKKRKLPSSSGSNVPGSTSSSSGGQMKSSIKDRVHAGGNIKKSVHFAQASPSDSHITKKRKLPSSSGNQSDYALANPSTKASGEKKYVKTSSAESIDHSTGTSFLLKKSEFSGKGPDTKQQVGTSISHKYSEVTRRPGLDASKWLKVEVWEEERLNEANEKGTLVVLENLDPSFAASEVEDIVWHVFKERVKAKMIPCTAFSSPLSGQALVKFNTEEAADKAVVELTTGSLVLGDGRPIVGRRRFIQKVGVADKFVGHLKIDRSRTYRQREEMRNAVSTSHFSQSNTIEFEMALQWHALQEKSNIWWKALLEEQAKEMGALLKQMKIHRPSEN